MRTRQLLAATISLGLATTALLLLADKPEPEPVPRLEDDEAEWSRSEQEEFMCQIGYVQC